MNYGLYKVVASIVCIIEIILLGVIFAIFDLGIFFKILLFSLVPLSWKVINDLGDRNEDKKIAKRRKLFEVSSEGVFVYNQLTTNAESTYEPKIGEILSIDLKMELGKFYLVFYSDNKRGYILKSQMHLLKEKI